MRQTIKLCDLAHGNRLRNATGYAAKMVRVWRIEDLHRTLLQDPLPVTLGMLPDIMHTAILGCRLA